MPAITILIAPICLRSINTDRAYTPAIYRLTDRRALCSTTIITVAGTVLPPGQTAATPAADSDLTAAVLPAAYRYLTAPPAVITVYKVDKYLGDNA